eukprot:217555-Rhodomonas_salina.1
MKVGTATRRGSLTPLANVCGLGTAAAVNRVLDHVFLVFDFAPHRLTARRPLGTRGSRNQSAMQ